jgi:predicted SnoaL-like aldol condensation-catalyzing enzyme
MATGSNKDVVRRFIEEVLAGGKLDQIDELLAPGYVNRAFGAGLEEFKGMVAGMSAALPDHRIGIEDLVAEGDAVVARYTSEIRDGSGKTISFRGLTFYRLADGKIVEDDPVTTPDLTQELSSLPGSPPP